MFRTRLLSGVVLVAIALVTMSLGGEVLLATLLFLSVVAYLELAKAAGVVKVQKNTDEPDKKGTNKLVVAGIAATVLYYGLLFVGRYYEMDVHFIILGMLLIAFFAMMFVYVFQFPKYESEQVMTAFFSFLYGPVCLSFIYLTRNLSMGFYIVWLILLCSWGCDTCAYCVGMLFGKHKMSPVLSPKKSVEGAVGGVVGAALLGALYGMFVNAQMGDVNAIVIFAIICIVGALISMVGDLAASAIKRNHDIKDYGKLIPGHGGVMDRFDSVIFTAPMIYILAMLLV